MKRLVFPLFWLSIFLCAFAATGAKPEGSTQGGQVPQAGTRPKPLSAAQKLSAAKASLQKLKISSNVVGGVKGVVKLSPRSGFVSGLAKLTFFGMSYVSFEQDFAQFSKDRYALTIEFKPSKPGMYLVDVAVQVGSSQGGTFSYGSPLESVPYQTMYVSNQVGHLTLVHHAQNTSWQRIDISGKASWNFYGCEISALN